MQFFTFRIYKPQYELAKFQPVYNWVLANNLFQVSRTGKVHRKIPEDQHGILQITKQAGSPDK